MKTILAGLLDDVVGTYDQTKTTIAGRVQEHTVNGSDAIGPSLTKFIDVFTDTGIAPLGPVCVTPEGKLFVLGAITAGVGSIFHYTFNLTTGAYAYVGRLNYTLPNSAATTHTVRGLEADTTTSVWKIFIATTGSVLINGGLFMINDVGASDFVPIGASTLAMATGSDQKAVYFLQNPSALGVSHTQTASAGISLDTASTKVYVHNGVAATHQFHNWDYSGTPNVPGTTVTITIASPGVVTDTGHSYIANDPIVLSTTGALPTGLTAGTTYFVRNPTANTYELSATSGGASINTTGTQSGVHTARRAHGITGSFTYVATGNLPALSGTLLLTDSEQIRTPTSGPNSGSLCVFFGTTTNAYEGKISELTSAVTAWPSLRSCNILGSGVDITTPSALSIQFDANTQRLLIQTNTTKIIVKPFQNSTIDFVFGSLTNRYIETYNYETVNFGSALLPNIEIRSGWLFGTATTTGQRGILVMDFYSDSSWDYSYVISPVLTVNNAVIKSIHTWEAYYEETGTISFYYRTSGFGSASGGWVALNTAEELNIASGTQIQFKFAFDLATQDVSTPAQLIDLLVGVEPLNENSENWEGSVDNSSTGSPTRCAFRLKEAYAVSVPSLRFVATDTSDNILQDDDTVAETSKFEYSTNDGSSWNSLGTIPNTVGTLVRYTFTTPPGVKIRPALKEL